MTTRIASEARPAARGLPVVAIVGRPNVGKSTLFNRLVGARRAIVDDAPGVTRDRVVAPAAHAGRAFLCVDTGGFTAEPPRDRAALAARVHSQTLAAVAEADCVLCVLDGAAGLAPEDRETVRLLRRSGKPVVYAVNKLDTPGREPLLHDFQALGVEPLLPVSAAHGRGVADLLDALGAALPEAAPAGEEARGTRLALIGRPTIATTGSPRAAGRASGAVAIRGRAPRGGADPWPSPARRARRARGTPCCQRPPPARAARGARSRPAGRRPPR